MIVTLVLETHGQRFLSSGRAGRDAADAKPGRRDGPHRSATCGVVLAVRVPRMGCSMIVTALARAARSAFGDPTSNARGRHAARPPGDQDLPPARRGRDPLRPAIAGIGGSRDEPVGLETGHESGHRRALTRSSRASRPIGRAAEDQHGQGRQAGRALARGTVLAGEPAQQMEDRRVETGRELIRIAGCWLDILLGV